MNPRLSELGTSIGFRMRLKPGVAEEYRRRHDAIWPELLSILRDAGIYDYSIFLDRASNDLFAVLKLAPDHRRDSLPAHPVMQRWWDYMADLMVTSDADEGDVGDGSDGSDEGDEGQRVERSRRPKEWPLEMVFHMD